MSVSDLVKEVASDRRIQKMILFYVPIISMYGLLIGYAQRIIESEFYITAIEFIILFGMLRRALLLGIIAMGIYPIA
ncbi:MAG: hypothetical protein R6V83_04060 [Candidatus Thorarchaeota archaeon]